MERFPNNVVARYVCAEVLQKLEGETRTKSSSLMFKVVTKMLEVVTKLMETFNLRNNSLQAPHVFDPKTYHALIVLERHARSQSMFHEAYKLG